MIAPKVNVTEQLAPAPMSVWEAVRLGLAADSTSDDHSPNIYKILKNNLDIAQMHPVRAEGVVTKVLNDRTGQYHVLKNPRTRTYLRLTPHEFWLWERLDGTHSVQDLVVAFFLEQHTFALALVVGLVERLQSKHLLRESPQRVFEDVTRALAERTIAYRLTWPARVMLTRPWAIGGLDKLLTRLHHRGGWIFYALPAQVVYLIVSLVGGYLFIRLLGDPRFTFGGEMLGAGIALLWIAAILPIVIHELGHALTTKHYGCEVPYGGLMLYFGMPAAFVDTSDVWMEGRRARLAVTWAGPYTGLIIGGFGAIVLWLLPELTLAPFIFQIATVGMFTAVLNLNPLIKLDGYYLLSDALEIPQLRERSFAFVRHKCLPKLSRRERFSRDELIFVAFGVLSAVWTVYVILVSLVVWNARVASSAQTILAGQSDPIALLINGLLILLAASFLALIGFQLYQVGQAAVAWARRAKLFADSGRAALTIGLAAAAVAFSPALLVPEMATGVNLIIGFAAFAWFVRLALKLLGEMRGSSYALMWVACAAGGITFAVAQIFRAWSLSETQDIARGLDIAGLTLTGLALAAGWQLMIGLGGSWRARSVVLLALGTASLLVLLSFDGGAVLPLHTFAGLLLAGGLIHWGMVRLHSLTLDPSVALVLTTEERLAEACQELFKTILGQLSTAYGIGTVRRVESKFNRLSQERALEMTLTAGELAVSNRAGAELTVADLAEILASALDVLFETTRRAAGDAFVHAALKHSLDALDWEQREIVGEYILPHMSWTTGLSEQLAATQRDVLALLQDAPLFAEFEPAELKQLAGKMRAEYFARGQVLLRQGEKGDRLYLLRWGQVQVLERDEHGLESKLYELASGDYFGETVLLTGKPRSTTVRTLTPVQVFSLRHKDLKGLARANFVGQGKMDTVLKRVALLRDIPLFGEFDNREMKQVVAQLTGLSVDSDRTIIRQGDAGDRFFIVEAGEVVVRERLPDGTVVERARLGAGEYFGEIELLMNIPRAATVVATCPTQLLSLDTVSFDKLVRGSRRLKDELERIATRRILSNRRRAKV